MNNHEKHPLDPTDDDPEGPSENDESVENDDAVFGAGDDDTETPPRPLLKPSLYVLGVGFAIAFICGVWASNSAPNSTGETLGSWLQRVGIIVMLVAFCGILFAYRFTYLKELWLNTKTPSFSLSDWMLMVPIMLAVVGLHGIALLLLRTPLGNSIFLLSLAIIATQASLCATMIVYSQGIWRGFCIGFVAVVALCIMGGGLSYSWSLLATGMTFRRTSRVTPVWPAVAIHAFFVLNGFISAGYVWLHQRMLTDQASATEIESAPGENT